MEQIIDINKPGSCYFFRILTEVNKCCMKKKKHCQQFKMHSLLSIQPPPAGPEALSCVGIGIAGNWIPGPSLCCCHAIMGQILYQTHKAFVILQMLKDFSKWWSVSSEIRMNKVRAWKEINFKMPSGFLTPILEGRKQQQSHPVLSLSHVKCQ